MSFQASNTTAQVHRDMGRTAQHKVPLLYFTRILEKQKQAQKASLHCNKKNLKRIGLQRSTLLINQ